MRRLAIKSVASRVQRLESRLPAMRLLTWSERQVALRDAVRELLADGRPPVEGFAPEVLIRRERLLAGLEALADDTAMSLTALVTDQEWQQLHQLYPNDGEGADQ